jgi:prepilin-type N-terminal cleavage/methylation domain-containing protein
MCRKAFTLVELLMVIAIISILAGLLTPVIMGAREQARRLNCANNLSQIGKAIKNFSIAHENFIPTQGLGPYNMQGWSGVPGRLMAGGYLDDSDVKIFKCPSSQDKPTYNAANQRITYSSYAYNRMPVVIGVRRDHIALAADEDCIPQGSQGQKITPNHHYKGANVLMASLTVGWFDAEDGAVNGVAIVNKRPSYVTWNGSSEDYLWKYDGLVGGFGGSKFSHFKNTSDNYLVIGKGDPANGGYSYSEFIEED